MLLNKQHVYRVDLLGWKWTTVVLDRYQSSKPVLLCVCVRVVIQFYSDHVEAVR